MINQKITRIFALSTILFCTGILTGSLNSLNSNLSHLQPHHAAGNVPPAPVVCEPWVYNINLKSYASFNWTKIENCTYIVHLIFNDTSSECYRYNRNSSVNDTNFISDQLCNNSRTYFYVTAVNDSGESNPSNIICAYAVSYFDWGNSVIPPYLQVENISPNEYRLFWDWDKDDNTQLFFRCSLTNFTINDLKNEYQVEYVDKSKSLISATQKHFYMYRNENWSGYVAAVAYNGSGFHVLSNVVYLNFTYVPEKVNTPFSISGIPINWFGVINFVVILYIIKKSKKK